MKTFAVIENTRWLRRLKHELLFPVHWLRWRLMSRDERTRKLMHASAVRMSPDFHRIPKHPDTAKLIRRRLVMHNGLRVLPTAYYGYQFLARSRLCDTVDEPQEERLFFDVLQQLPANSVMLELGSFWAFYSMWFHAVVPGARNYMIEPELRNLSYGRTNFEINGFEDRTDFTHAFIDSHSDTLNGVRMVCVDDFCTDKGIEHLAILHADIQGFELPMLRGAKRMLGEHRVDYVFISTHSNDLHRQCIEMLMRYGYHIVSDANLDEAYQADGVILACRPGLPHSPINPATKRTLRASDTARAC
jgi:hypothetical protein